MLDRLESAAGAPGAERVAHGREAGLVYRSIVEHAPFPALLADAALRLKAGNPALSRVLGFRTEEELLAHAATHGLFAEPQARERFLSQHAASEWIHDAVVEWLGRGGRLVPLRVSGRSIRDADGALTGFELVAEDLSERRVLEEQLRQAQKMELLGRLTGGIAHDLNNLLTVMLASADQVAESGASAAAVSDLRMAVRRAQVLVRRLVGFSRREDLRVHPVDLVAHVSEIGRLLRRLVRAPVEITVSAAPSVPPVLADESAIDQVLFNLVTNAQDAMPAGGTLAIRVEPGEERVVRLVVSDTGMGMDAATRAHLFEPFFTTKPRGVGTGLGLTTVQAIVARLGGEIEVRSATGVGTTVVVSLPASDSGIESALPSQVAPALGRGKGTVMVVDDEYALRTVAQRLLGRAGYTVVLAEDGEQALELLRARGDVDLVISDVVMPRMGGVQLYRVLGAQGVSVPFLFVSGYGSDEIRDVAQLPANVPLISKPWTPQELLGAVAQALPAAAT
ncbi:MAG TPA: ATP-binding protein [Gemmatimonadales bacterium]|nr:ATP-binding protein [Gemmatimonadales bacterium]